jgi:hypothetical protein
MLSPCPISRRTTEICHASVDMATTCKLPAKFVGRQDSLRVMALGTRPSANILGTTSSGLSACEDGLRSS